MTAGTKARRWIAGGVAALAIGAALGVGALRFAAAQLPDIQSRVARQIQAETGLALSFDSLDARFGRYGPEVYFGGARLVGAERGEVLVTARAGRVSFAILRSLLHRRLEIGRVVLESPRLDFVIFPDRHIELAGQSGIALRRSGPRREFGLERLPRGVVEIRDATLGFRDLGLEAGDFEVRRVDLVLERGAKDLVVEGRVDLPRRFGRRLELAAGARGALADPGGLDWRLDVDLREVDFAGLAASFPWARALPSRGRGSLRIEAEGTGRTLAAAAGSFAFENLRLPAVAGTPAPAYRRAAADFSFAAEDDGWRLALRDLELSTEGRSWEPGPLAVVVHRQEGRPARVELEARYLRLENLLPLVGLAPASAARELALELAPRGVLRDVQLRVAGFAPGRVPDVEGRLAFEELGLAPRGKMPGFDGLAGRLEARDGAGRVALEARDLALDWPAEWRGTQRFASLEAEAGWERMPFGLRLFADELQVDTAHGRARGRLRLLQRPGETPLLDLEARVEDVDMTQLSRYLPTSRLAPKPLAWLDGAFRAGRIVSGEARVTGPVRGFPYRNGEGRFTARARVEGVTLSYAPGWPEAWDLAGEVAFAGPSFRAADIAGRVADVGVPRAVAELADWRDAPLLLRANFEGDAAAAHRLLASSPLGPKLGPAFAQLEAAGRLDGETVMVLPLKRLAERVVTVRVAGRGLRLGLAGLAEPLTAVAGELHVRNAEVYAPRLTGEFAGGGFEARLDTQRAPSGALTTRIEAAGSIEGARLQALLGLPPRAGLAGVTTWRASGVLPRMPSGGERSTAVVRIASPLTGLASALPAPFAKAASAPRPLSVEMRFEPDAAVELDATLDPDLRARLRFRRTEAGRVLDRGVVRVGGGAAGLPAAPGLHVEGRIPALRVSDWLELRPVRPGGRRLQDWLAEVDLDVGRLEVLGYEFERVAGRMQPGSTGWDVAVEAPAVAGRVVLPYDFDGQTPLLLELSRFTLGARARRGEGEADPRKLPPIRADIRALRFDRYDLGHLKAEIARLPDGLALERFDIGHAAYRASGRGRWIATDAGSTSALDFEIDSRDARGLLTAFGFAPLIEAREADIEARLAWPGPPDANVLSRVSGTASLRFAGGRVASVDPGAGRVLGLMSLAHLPRRLALDFDDVTDEGLAFDTVTGDFRLVDGTAYTDDLLLRGPATEIGIAGRTDLGGRSYDQTAIVTGQLGASIGVAGAIAGGPVVGAALFLISQIFKEPLAGAVRAYYRITGPWESPQVRKIDAEELREAAGLAVAPAGPGEIPAAGGLP